MVSLNYNLILPRSYVILYFSIFNSYVNIHDQILFCMALRPNDFYTSKSCNTKYIWQEIVYLRMSFFFLQKNKIKIVLHLDLCKWSEMVITISALFLCNSWELSRGEREGWKGEEPVHIICSHQSIVKLWRPHCISILKSEKKISRKKWFLIRMWDST